MVIDLPAQSNDINPGYNVHESCCDSPENVWRVAHALNFVISVRVSDLCLQLGLHSTPTQMHNKSCTSSTGCGQTVPACECFSTLQASVPTNTLDAGDKLSGPSAIQPDYSPVRDGSDYSRTMTILLDWWPKQMPPTRKLVTSRPLRRS